MKKLLYFLLLGLTAVQFVRCTDGVDDIFDQDATQRMEQKLAGIRSTLQSSANGWVLDYYLPEVDGAINILCKFREDGSVDMSRVIRDADDNIICDSLASSRYQVISSMGPIISFNTYNPILHRYADPDTNGVGMKGDYEFVVMDGSTDDMLVLKGKKHGARMTMWRMETGKTWEKFLSDSYEMMDRIQDRIILDWRKKVLLYNGKTEILKHNSRRGLQFPEELCLEQKSYIDFIVTDKGLRLQYPVQVNGQEVYEFHPNTETTAFKAPNADINLTQGSLALNEQLHYNATWYINGEEMCELYRDEWNAGMKAVPDYGALYALLGTTRLSDTEPVLRIDIFIFLAATPGQFYYRFDRIDGTTDQIRLSYARRTDNAGTYILNNTKNPTAVNRILSILGGAGDEGVTYRISVEEGPADAPTKIKLTNISNPQHYFYAYFRERKPATF